MASTDYKLLHWNRLAIAWLGQRPLKGKTDLTWQPLALRARGWIFDAQTKKTNRPLLRIKEVWRVECQQSYWSGWQPRQAILWQAGFSAEACSQWTPWWTLTYASFDAQNLAIHFFVCASKIQTPARAARGRQNVFAFLLSSFWLIRRKPKQKYSTSVRRATARLFVVHYSTFENSTLFWHFLSEKYSFRNVE